MVKRVFPLLLAACATVSPARAAPALSVALLDGPTVAWTSLLASQERTLVVFATVWCEVCRRERPAVEAWARAHRPERTVYVFSGGDPASAAAQIRPLRLDAGALTVVVDADGRLADSYRVDATPTVLVLAPDGRVLESGHRFAAVVRP